MGPKTDVLAIVLLALLVLHRLPGAHITWYGFGTVQHLLSRANNGTVLNRPDRATAVNTHALPQT